MLTPAEVEKRLGMIRYYVLSNAMWQEHIDRAEAGDPSLITALMAKAGRKAIRRNNAMKANAIRLLDYSADDTDKEVLRLYYVEGMAYFDIADQLHYSYTYITSKRADAFHRLAERLANYPAFKF